MRAIVHSLVAGSFLFTALSLAGCGQGLTAGDGSDGSDVSASQAGPAVWVRPGQSPAACDALPCASQTLQVVGSAVTKNVYKFNWQQLGLSQSEIDEATAHLGDMLLYGHLGTQRSQGLSLPVFVVEKAYKAVATEVSDDPMADHYYSVAPAVCHVDPCPSLAAQALGAAAGTPTWLYDLDLPGLGLSQVFDTLLQNDINQGADILSASDVTDGVAQVTQVFRPLRSAPLE